MAYFKTFQGNFEAFSYAVVFDSLGKPVPISRFWKEKPAILVFLRHFGCMACRAHAQDVWSKRELLQQSGSQLIFIGNGAANFIQTFREEFDLGDAPIFTDPSLKAFALAGFKHGFAQMASPQSAINMVKLAMKGHKNGNPLNSSFGSNRQLGGVVVVNPSNQVTYHYISEAIGDVPEGSEIPSSSSP